MTATTHVQTGTTELVTRSHAAGWWWLLSVGLALGLVLVAAGVVLVVRRRRNLSRAGRVAVAVVGVWASVGAIVVFLDDVRQGGDWVGGLAQAAFSVLYGLFGCAAVWAVDKTVRKLRHRSRHATSPG